MHEAPGEDDVTDEAPQSFMEMVGGTFDDKAGLVKALGVYLGWKRLRPNFDKGVFVKDDYKESTKSSEADKR